MTYLLYNWPTFHDAISILPYILDYQKNQASFKEILVARNPYSAANISAAFQNFLFKYWPILFLVFFEFVRIDTNKISSCDLLQKDSLVFWDYES